MTTRFYLPSSGAVPITPSFAAAWDDETIGIRCPTSTSKINSAMVSKSFGDNNDLDRSIVFAQYISPSLDGAQTVTGDVGFVIRASEGGTSFNMLTAITIRVLSNDGTSVTGTPLALTRDDTEMDTSLESRHFFATLKEVNKNDGDRVVIEIGTAGNPNLNGDHDSTLSIGDNAVNDLTASDTDVGVDNPWVEFNDINLVFQQDIGIDTLININDSFTSIVNPVS